MTSSGSSRGWTGARLSSGGGSSARTSSDLSQVRADSTDRNDSKTRVLDSLNQIDEVVQSGLVESLSVTVIRVSGRELLRVNHDHCEAISVDLLLDGLPCLRARNVLKVGEVVWVACLGCDREVPQVRVGKVIEWRVHLNAAGESGESYSLHGVDGSVVEFVVWEQKSGRTETSGGLNDSLGLSKS